MSLKGIAYRLSLQITALIDDGHTLTLEKAQELVIQRKVFEYLKNELTRLNDIPNMINSCDDNQIKSFEKKMYDRSPLLDSPEKRLLVSNESNGYLALLEMIITMFVDGDI